MKFSTVGDQYVKYHDDAVDEIHLQSSEVTSHRKLSIFKLYKLMPSDNSPQNDSSNNYVPHKQLIHLKPSPMCHWLFYTDE